MGKNCTLLICIIINFLSRQKYLKRCHNIKIIQNKTEMSILSRQFSKHLHPRNIATEEAIYKLCKREYFLNMFHSLWCFFLSRLLSCFPVSRFPVQFLIFTSIFLIYTPKSLTACFPHVVPCAVREWGVGWGGVPWVVLRQSRPCTPF